MASDEKPLEAPSANFAILPGKIDDIGRSSFIRERLAHPILDAETVDQAAAALDASIALIASLALHPVPKAGFEQRLRSDYGGAIETLTGS